MFILCYTDTQVDLNGNVEKHNQAVNDNADEDSMYFEQNIFNGQSSPIKKARKRRVRKLDHTVTKNKETINGKLDTRPIVDSLFSRWNDIPGDVNSTNKLFNNLLRTQRSDLKLNSSSNFFDASVNEPIEYNEDYIYDVSDADCLEIDLDIDPKLTLRLNLLGYQISNSISDDVILARR